MDASFATATATVVVAAISGSAAWASQRAANRASLLNTQTTSRIQREEEAYDRARAFDTETIARQDREIEELRSETDDLRAQLRAKDKEIADLRNRVFILEHIGPLKIHYEPPEVDDDLEEKEDDHELGRSDPS